MTSTTLSPEVLWAQTDKLIYLTINVADLEQQNIEFLPSSIKFDGSTTDKRYAFDLELYEEFDTERSRKSVTGRHIFLVLQKVEGSHKFWPRLQKASKKPAFLKIDFSRWIDEDEEAEEQPADNNFMNFAGGPEGMPQEYSDDEISEEEEEDEEEQSETVDEAVKNL